MTVAPSPVRRMSRVAVVAAEEDMRAALVAVADEGVLEAEAPEAADEHPAAADALRRLPSAPAAPAPVLAVEAPDLAALEAAGARDLLAGEAELARHLDGVVWRRSVGALVGWCPSGECSALRGRLAGVGAGLVVLPPPRGEDPPTRLAGHGPVRRSLGTLVSTYGTVPYLDVDPTVPAATAYVLMFGMMFGDAGHGLLLVVAALLLRAGYPRAARGVRGMWPFVLGAGVAATVFGVLFGEFFGPTGVLPVLWLSPLAAPLPLLEAAVGIGAVLLAGAYGLAVVNRWREGGATDAAYASAGAAGAALYVGLALVAGGAYLGVGELRVAGLVVALAGLGLAAVGFRAEAGPGPGATAQAVVQLFDSVVRLGSSVISFARLAAFGLTHAALSALVWTATVALWAHGGLGALGGVLVFVLGTAIALVLEGLVAAVQALRLTFYELFSRVFVGEGRPFRPWHVTTAPSATVGAPDRRQP